MTTRQQAELRRLKARNRLLETRNQFLSGTFSRSSLNRFAWLLHEIEAVCAEPHKRPMIRVSRSDVKLLRPILEGLVGYAHD